MKSAGKARNNGLYRHIRTSKEIIRNLLNDYLNYQGHKPIFPDSPFLHDPRFSTQIYATYRVIGVSFGVSFGANNSASYVENHRLPAICSKALSTDSKLLCV